MGKTETRTAVMNLLTQDNVNLSQVYARTGLARQVVLRALKAAHEAGLCVLTPVSRRAKTANGREAAYLVRITTAGLLWLQEPALPNADTVAPKAVVQGRKYARMDQGLAGAVLLTQAW